MKLSNVMGGISMVSSILKDNLTHVYTVQQLSKHGPHYFVCDHEVQHY